MSGSRRATRRVRVHLMIVALGCWAPATANGQPSCRADGQLLPVKDALEISGVAASVRSPGVVWTHNDSGEPIVVSVGADGIPIGRVWIAGAAVEDWEDIGVGPCPTGSCLYIADIGDNNMRRGSVTIYRVPEPDPTSERTRRAESMRLTYPDGARDAEALIVMPNGSVFVVTKGERSSVTLYRAGSFTHGATKRLEPVATVVEGMGGAGVPRQDRVTGAGASRDGRLIVLRTLSAMAFYHAADLESGRVREIFRYDLSALRERQGEGVAFGDGETIWLSSEGGGGRPGTVAKLTCTLPS